MEGQDVEHEHVVMHEYICDLEASQLSALSEFFFFEDRAGSSLYDSGGCGLLDFFLFLLQFPEEDDSLDEVTRVEELLLLEAISELL